MKSLNIYLFLVFVVILMVKFGGGKWRKFLPKPLGSFLEAREASKALYDVDLFLQEKTKDLSSEDISKVKDKIKLNFHHIDSIENQTNSSRVLLPLNLHCLLDHNLITANEVSEKYGPKIGKIFRQLVPDSNGKIPLGSSESYLVEMARRATVIDLEYPYKFSNAFVNKLTRVELARKEKFIDETEELLNSKEHAQGFKKASENLLQILKEHLELAKGHVEAIKDIKRKGLSQDPRLN